MEKPKIYVHGSYIGTTGYNNHTRDFLRELSKHTKVKVRNFTVGNSWNGYNYGDELPEATYYYIFTAGDGTASKFGDVTIIR